MFSSKFLSGANPLNAVSSAVNKFGLFGDDGEGNKNQKAPSQHGVMPAGEQQPGAGPGKGPQQQQGPQKSGQGPPMQKTQPLPKQGAPQLQGNGQAGPPNKPGGQPSAPKAGTQSEGQLEGEPQKNQPHGSPKPVAQQQILTKSGAQPESPKASSQQQVPPKTGMQKQGPSKTGVQESPKVGSQKNGSQQGSPKVGQQQQGSPKLGQQQQGSPKLSQQQQGSPKIAQKQQGSSKVGPQQQGFRTTPQQQISDKPKVSGTPGLSRAESSSPGATKAGSLSKAVAKSLCPVCKTTELNMHTKEPSNHKTCTHCKTEVCSLCGFSPPDSDGHEWLCLTCQIQRAQGTSEPLGPSTKKASPHKTSATRNQTQSPAAPDKNKISATGSPQKMQSTLAKVPAKGEAAKGPESQKQTSPVFIQKITPETKRTSGSKKTDQTSQTACKQSSVTSAPQQESGGLFGFGGTRNEAAKPEESVTGKMFGFGSSFFSSASTLIASTVQDEPKTTPPVSPKMQSTKESKPLAIQKSVQDKKQDQPQQAKAHLAGLDKVDEAPSETPKAAAASYNVSKAGVSTCPLCKMVLNMGSKDPPNYNTCTECKSTVCNQCGFNPKPNFKEGKEWLCLNCQVKQVGGRSESQKDTSLVKKEKKTTPAQPELQKTSAPGSPQRKVSTPVAQPAKVEATKGPDSYKQTSPAPGQKTPQENQKKGPQKQPDQTSQTAQKQRGATPATQQESGGFFGFGGPKSQSDAAKPAESVAGKMFGFGSSIFSSASTLISSSVQDEPKTAPPVSPKMLAAKESKSPTAKKPEQEKKPEQPQQTKGPPSTHLQADKPPSKPSQETSASPVISKAGQSTCPLCKLELNVGSKDPPNYNTCTVCRTTVCNQCGFNPMPNVKEVKEWLCLNCQMQRALGASEPPGTPMMKLQASPNKVMAPASALNKATPTLEKPQKKDIPTTTESKKKETSAPGSSQRKSLIPEEQTAMGQVVKGPESQKQVNPAPGQKTPQEGQKTCPQKPPDQISQTGHKERNTTSTTQQASGGFFGFSGPKPQPDSAKPAESLGGKMFGFGSSIFSSASTLINSSVLDDSKTTPPVSPKMPTAKATKSPLDQKEEQGKKLEQVQQPKTSPLLQAKVAPSEPPKDVAASPAVPKAGQSTCPLCKVEFNFGSKEPPNYNNCTECKNTVCNQCGFNPMPNVSEVTEWLCLNCQMQRALSASELTTPPIKLNSVANKISPSAVHQKITAPIQVETLKRDLPKSDAPVKMETPVADTLQKKGSSMPGSPQKTQPTAVTQETKMAKGPQSDTQAIPTPGQKTPLDIKEAAGSQKPADQTSQTGLKQIESGNLFALSGPQTRPKASKTTESMTGKMFGFGSSIFSSASTLITSAVQEERTTPPDSRKMSAPAQISPKMSAVPKISPKSTPTVSPKMSPAREPKTPTQITEQKKKAEDFHQSKEDRNPSQPPVATTISNNADEATCPLCKAELNIGSKDHPNYNTCTECKSTVCTHCGFDLIPIGEVKEWLCLNCQMKRAVGASEPQGPPTMKSQTSPSKVPSSATAQLKDSSKPTTLEKKDIPGPAVQKKEMSEPLSPHRKQSTPSVQSGKPEATTAPLKQASPEPDNKTPQGSQRTGPKKPPDQASQPGCKQSNATAATQQESVGFFGFGGPKSQPDAANPAVTGKMFGFGSSIFSSASTLITSAVQDQPKTTPPVSPKMSPAKEMKPPNAQKLELQKKTETSQQTKTPPSGQAKLDKTQSQPPKAAAASQGVIKPGQSTCPLCKVKLNMGSKDLPNYNTCTECKNTVCNQCGFNPMPNETALKEWLCLTCQMQQALGVTNPSGVPSVKSPEKLQKKDIISPAEPENKQLSAPHSSQRKLFVTAQPAPTEAANKPEGQKQSSPFLSQKRPQEPQKTSGPNKTPDQKRQTDRKQSNATAEIQQESGGFFVFGGGKTQPDAAKPAESVTGKMFGFGSSIFGSASTLIASAVQDQPKTTPPVSPKMSPAKDIKSPAVQKKDQQKKPEQQTKTPPLVQAKADKALSEPPKAAAASPATVKSGQSTCPLCKVELNIGSKDPPNYNTCNKCKNTVCNQCGFNTMPNVSEMEWLCLTCQMQKARTASESVEPPLMKPQASSIKVSTCAAADNQKKDIISTQKAEGPDENQRDSPPSCAPQKKEETKPPFQMDITQTSTTASLYAKETPGTVSTPTEEEKTGSKPTKEVPTSTTSSAKEMSAVVSDLNKPLPAQAPTVNTDIETSLQKKNYIIPPSSPATKEVSEKKEEKTEIVQKSADQPVTSTDELQPQQALNKESNPVETSLAKSAPPATQPTNQESGGFPSFGSPKSQRAASNTTEAMTGKMLGFGSSLFSSASTLITSAVQESRKTPPSSRKMSAPAQVSDKMSASQISLKSTPPVSLRMTSAKEAKPPAAQKPHLEKIQDQSQQAKALPSGQAKVDRGLSDPAKPEASQAVGQSTCPLCKADFNMGSKDLPNYNTCTECKTSVCNKCGFSPVPNVTEVKEWLCLNCQMQRALGASEPPGLPMIKPQSSPSKEVPATTQKQESPVSASQEDIPKPVSSKNELVNVATIKATEDPALGSPSKKVSPTAASLPDQTREVPKGQPGTPEQQPPKAVTSLPKSALPPDQEAGKTSSQELPKAVTSIAKSAPPPDQEAGKPPPQQPPKAGASPARSVKQPAQPAKQESGGFFGFGGPKTHPTVAQSAGSVTGKMFGFGSSFLTSASTLITSAVQDEPKTAPPTSRKMSTTAHVSPKTTPPASPKTLPAKDIKPPGVQKTEEKKAEKPQQERTPSTVQTIAPSEAPKMPTDICPLCKVDLNMGSKDLPNYNTCTECRTTVCNQCGFNPVPNVAEVKEWLCLNCQMQRAQGASEPTGHPVVKPQPSPSKVITPPGSEQKDIPTLVQKEKSTKSSAVKEEVTQAPVHKKETPKAEAPVPTAVQKMDILRQGSMQKTQVLSDTEQGQGQGVCGEQQPVEKSAQVQLSQTTELEVKTALVKQGAGKPPQQPSKSPTPAAKSAPPPAQPAKQESGSFFGFSGPKTQPAATKSAESVTGKMFGFGSSIFSSASTLITSAVQDEPKTTPPTPRKMSTTAHVSPKTTPPVSPKMSPAKETKPPSAQKLESPQQAMSASSAQTKVEKVPSEPPKSTEVARKGSLSTCPLCKVELNMGSQDPPNYNTCTECKNTVCDLCGFNPMPHTAAKEWLCLNCQTQRALLGQLGDSGKTFQPSPVSAMTETQARLATKKTEPATVATKSQPTPAPIKAVPTAPTLKAKMEPTYVKMETTATVASAQIELGTTLKPTTAKVSPVTTEKEPLVASTAEPIIPAMKPVQNRVVTPKVEVPSTDVPKTVTVGDKEEVIPTFPNAAEVAMAGVVPATETQSELPATAIIIEELQLDDHIKLKEPIKSLQQVEVRLKSQESQLVLEVEPIKAAEEMVADKLVEKIIDVTSTPETQPVSTKNIIIKEQDETKKEPMNEIKVSLPIGQVKLENTVVTVTATESKSKAEEHDEDQPQILPILQELEEEHVVSDTSKNYINTYPSTPLKEEVKAERKRLSFQTMDESSESELTPSPSPKVQRRRLKVSNISSSSEDIKTESADSYMEDEEFIRMQIMGMGDEEEMALSEDEKENNLANEDAIKEAELDNASVTPKSLSRKSSTDKEDSPAGKKALPKTDTATTQDVPDTMSSTTFKKAIPVMRQRQSTDEELESITDSLSKGSSSVQASSFTPGSSPTSASSLEEDSDSSPSHRKISGDKQHRKGKHRQPTQPLPTIEDSSEDEKIREEEKSRKDKDELRAYSQPLSPTEDASSTEDLRQVTVMDESGSEFLESEPETRQAIERGHKHSPTVMPYTSSDPFKEKDTVTKSLKSAEEAYEEIIQKTKTIPVESPPDIEPLYGGMAIEDYLYESLVEEPDIKMSDAQEEELKQDTGSESLKKLRSPEEVYEEMMQKKRELMMIEQEFQQAQTAMESSSLGAPVTGPPTVAETCVVTIPTEETYLTEQIDMPLTGTEISTEVPVKKKKRPAPPRPSEPPKRSEVTVVPSTPGGSIGFVRPMLPQDPALRKTLFPIPDLKITQCSSGEEEDDSLADEYGVGISSDITPSDDSETKEDPSISPPLSETTEMEPICVVCEIPEPRPIPTPISAPELTTTPSPVSPVSPPTSPATPDSSLASNATSSSSFQAQTPISPDSTPLSTPTPPTSFVTQSPPEISPLSTATTAAVLSNRSSVSSPTTVIVAIPDVVSDPSKAQTTAVLQVKASTAEAPTPALVKMSSSVPVVVQMPDLVSSPSQLPIEAPAVIQVSAPSPGPVVVSAQPTALVAATPIAVSTQASAHVVSASDTLALYPGPVTVQMPDLVSATSLICVQTPLPVSALVTTTAQAQAKVVHSVPVQPAVPPMSPVVVPTPAQTAQVPAPAPASTTILKKKFPPPPPPRSTSVSSPEPNRELPLVRTVQHVTPAVTTTVATEMTVTGQPMQSVVVDIQPRMEEIQPDSVAVPQVVTPTRQGHVVIIVPSVENISLLGQIPPDVASTGPFVSTPSLPLSSQIAIQPASDIPSTDTVSLSTKVSAVPVASAPPLPPKSMAGTRVIDTVRITVADTPPTAIPMPTVYPKPPVATAVTATVAQVFVTTIGPSQTAKPPPPIPPKPVSIPAGLVFSHKPGESVKPPLPVAPKATTLPRTKEPPNALSLSLTRPVESKFGATSPKSPLSPRHAKCLQTYVVITLPSEPGSPTEGITVQAPVRRGSIPSTKVSGVQITPSEQKTPAEAFSAQATVRRASVPTVRYPPPIPIAPTVAVEQVTPSEKVAAQVQGRDSVPSVVQPPLSVANVIAVSSGQDTSIQVHSVPLPIKKPYVQQQQSIAQPLPPPKTMSEDTTMPTEPMILIQPLTVQTTARAQSILSVAQHPNIATEGIKVPPEVSPEALVPQAPIPTLPVRPQPLTEVIAVPRQPEISLDALVPQGKPAAVPSTVLYSQVATQIEMLQKEQDMPTDVIVTEAVMIRSPIPGVSQQIPVQQPLTTVERFKNTHTIAELPPVPQTVQPLEVLSLVTEQLSTQQPLHVAEVVTLPKKFELPTEVIITDSAVRISEVATLSPVPHPLPVVAEVSPTPEVAKLIPLTTIAKMSTPTIGEVTPSTLVMEVQQMAVQPEEPCVTHIPQGYAAITSSVMSHSTPPLEVISLKDELETTREIITKDADVRRASIPSSVMQPQAVTGMPVGVITTEETTSRRRTSISSIVQPPYTTSEIFSYPAEYETPTQVVTTEAFAATRRKSITMQQPLPLAQVVNMPAERDVPIDGHAPQVPYRRGSIPSTEQRPQVLTYSSEYDQPLEIITSEAYTSRTSIPTAQDIPQGVSVAPVTITKIQQESIESQEIRGPEKVVSSMSHMYSSSISTSGEPPESLPSLVTQVVTTEVQRTTVSVVHERLPQVPPPSVAITIQPDIAKVQPLSKQNGKIYSGDVIDLRTIKVGVKMTEQGMDLTPRESCRQSFPSDSGGRQITAVQPEIVNLSAEITPATTLSVVTDTITIVTCTATIASYNSTPAEKPLDLQGPVTSLPLPLTTYKPFEPLAQIVYRPVNSQAVVSTVASTAQDIPINLSFGVSSGGKPITSASAAISNGGPILSLEATGAMDLSNYRPVRAMVALSGTSPGVVTTVVEDDVTPVDLTAGRRSVCCDVIYKLPFTGSCRTQPPVTTQPENHFGYKDDHYHNAGLYGIKGMNGVKVSMSETNLTEAGLFSYDPKDDHNYLSGSSDGAIDLTAAKLSAGKALDYTSKATGGYPGMTTAPYSQVPAAGFGVNSVLRTSDGIVYSSVAAPIPSTYAITTQPGSIFSGTLTPTSTVQNQLLPHPYGFIPSTDPGQLIPFDTGLPKDILPTALADIITGYPDMYSDTTLEAIAASLDALASSPIFPGLDNTKMAQYQMEREFLELEKLKQLCLAEELEWERQEIQRYREQEQLMVQRELEELQALKQQLLLQQEEEHHAHMVAQQETYAQQKEQLQQIQQLQLQLQRQLDEHYGSTGTTGNLLDAKYAGVGDSGQYWPVKDESTIPYIGTQFEESQDQLNLVKKLQDDQDTGKKIIDSGVQTDDEDSAEKQHVGRRKKNKRNVDSSAQTDDEDQDEWDAPTKARRRSRKHSSDGKHGSKVSSIAIQTVAEISVQTDHSGTIKRPNVQMDTKVEIIKHISAPENSQRGGSLSCQTDLDRRQTPIEVGYSTLLTTDVPSKSKVFYNSVSPLSPEKSLGGQRMLTADPNRFSSGPRILKAGQKSLSDPKSLSPTTEERMGGYYADSYSGRGSPSGTGKKVKRTLPDPPPEDDSLTGRSGYSTNSARRRLARSTTMARAKILQDIDKELDLVERESSKLRKKQAELDEEEKEIDAKLRYLEMGINRRKEALLKEREKRERAYLQGVAEERDYMSDSEVSNIRETRGDCLERPRTAPQSEFDQFIPPQTEADSQYNTLTSPYSHYAQYVPQTQTTSHYTQQNLYQQQSLYHQQVSPYPTLSLTQAQPSSYQHALILQQGKQRQTTLSDLEPKISTNYEVMRNQPLLIVPTSTESGYGVPHLGSKYGNLDLRLGLEERSMASSPMSSISADSFYADIDHHNARNYMLIEDIGELTKASTGLSNTGLGSGFNLPDKELSKADRLLRAAEVRRTAEVADFLGSSRLQSYNKGEDDTMEEPYELKLLKQQIKQEFRRGTEGLEHLTGLGLPQYLPSDSSFRHFPKGEKYSIGRLTLEKQAAKQLPAALLYQKQMKNKKALIDPKAITKFSPIQESRDLEPDFASYIGSGASSVTNLAATARLLQDEITFGLRKNLSEQQKYLGSSLGANLAGSLNLGQSLGLGSTIRATAQDDGTYPSGTRSRPTSRPSSRPSSVYGLDLSIKRDLSSSSLRLKTEGEVLDAAFAPGVARAKPTSLPISQSRGRIPIVAQNSEEESPLSPVGQPMGMARASAGPLPPISADSRDQFGSSHSLPEVQQHMREESRTRGYDRDIAFIMDDLQGAMSDSEALSESMLALSRDDARIFHESIRHAYHLRREDTDWFDKPREGHPQSGNMSDRRQMKLVPYAFPHTRIKLKRDLKDTSVSGNGLGIRVVGGKEIPGSRGEIGAYIAKVIPGGVAEQTEKVVEGMQVLEWNGVPLTAKTYEEVQCIMGQPCAEAELCVRLDLNMLSDPEHPQALEHHVHLKAGGQRSPGVDPKQLAAELQKVSQQQAPGMAGTGVGPGGLGVLSALERSALLHSGTGSAASSGVPSPGQPASPAINKKQRHKPTEVMKIPHPITGEIQLQINYDRNLGNLIVHVLQARNLAPRDNDGYSDPFVKVYLLPGRGQVMVVQNASADNKRRTRYAQKTMNPEWNQTVIYKNIHLEQLKKKTLEVTVWDYDRSSSNDFLGEVLIDLSNTAQLDNTPRWLPLKEQSESIEHSRAHHAAQGPPGSGSGQGHGQGHGQGYMSVPGMGPGHGVGQGQAPGQGDGSHDSPKNSVIKSRSHGIFPDPAKDMQMMPLEKSHSSPGSSKSSSDGQLRSHGPSRSQSKSSVTQAHLEDAGIAIAAAEAAVQQSRLQPRPGHRLGDISGSVVLSAPSLVGDDAYGDLDGEEGAGTGVDSAIFQVPRIGKTIPDGIDKNQVGTPENEGGKTQVMGEIKVALKKEVKTEGDQLILEILQCRNITYKFKSPDHLPDLYVKLYVVNVATQKRIIKKKTRVCRHDREPSFNETFRFSLNPTGHSIQLFLVSNGGKFMKKTLIGEAYIWLDKVDMRKRVVSWHKLFVSSTQINP